MLGERVRQARSARGLSLRRLATLAGCTPSLLSQIETGKSLPSVTRLAAIATQLDVSVDHLLGVRTSDQVAELAWMRARLAEIAPGADLDLDRASPGSRILTLFLVEGQLEVRSRDGRFALALGSALHLAADAQLRVLNLGAVPARVLVGETAADDFSTTDEPSGGPQ